jgi:hypothetical protein
MAASPGNAAPMRSFVAPIHVAGQDGLPAT